jgi:diguanylate cyclase (GGDEF)-like protein
MADFLASQIDFILFFHGLAATMLGLVALAISRMRWIGGWRELATFGIAQGVAQWFAVMALVVGDTPAFAAVRLAVMAAAYLSLVDSGRLEAISFGAKLPNRWALLPLLLPTAIAGWSGGLETGRFVAHCSLALPGGIATGLLFFWHAKGFNGIKRWVATIAGLLLIGYMVAATLLNAPVALQVRLAEDPESFRALEQPPIQLLLCLLAGGIALCLWTIWGRIAGQESGSERYAAFLRRLFRWVLLTVCLTLTGGWVVTETLGNIYRGEIEDEADGDIKVLASRLSSESATLVPTAALLAKDPAVLALTRAASLPQAETARIAGLEQLRAQLRDGADVAGAHRAFVLDSSGRMMASDDAEQAGKAARNFIETAAFIQALSGHTAQSLSYEAASDETSVFVAAPVIGADRMPAAVIVLEKSLEQLDDDLADFDRPWFLVDPEGVIVLTNRPDLRFRALWPIAARKLERLTERYPTLDSRPLLHSALDRAIWTSFQGEQTLIRKSEPGHRNWSMVMALPPTGHYASRALGIVITLLGTLLGLTYLLGRERQVHDSIEMERRLELELIAQDMRSKANTDPLTGLYNRLRFDHAMAEEIARSERYRSPLALVLFDIDHFKRVNDTFGHQAGDAVLQHLARIAAGATRSSDVLARWGGEEFVLLTPGCDVAAAERAAEKLRQAVAAAEFDAVGRVTCSFGVAQLASGDSAQSVVARADEALYRAKAKGRNRVETEAMRRAAE